MIRFPNPNHKRVDLGIYELTPSIERYNMSYG